MRKIKQWLSDRKKRNGFGVMETRTNYCRVITDCTELDSLAEKAERLADLYKEVRDIEKELTSLRRRRVKIPIEVVDVNDCEKEC